MSGYISVKGVFRLYFHWTGHGSGFCKTTMAFEELIEKMKQTGRFNPGAAFESSDLDKWESEHNMKLPDSFRTILTAGSYDIANFYFHPLKESVDFPGFVLFARWNDDEFALKIDNSDEAVYVLLKGEQPYRKSDTFQEWFRTMADLTARTNNPE